ncbi:MAG: asparagine synthase-related protein [Planctomycetaceae bacterium]
MALFVLLLDPDADRRAAFLSALPAPLPGLARGSCASGCFLASWDFFPGAPVDSVADEAGAAIVWGEAIPGPGPGRARAVAIRAADDPGAFDGYFAAAAYDRRAGLRVAGDLLGVFPVHWWAGGGVLLCGSSAELFRAHPLFRPALDPHGLVGLLLTHGLVAERTLLAGVTRLGPGERLHARLGETPRLLRASALRTEEALARAPFGEQVDALDAALAGAVARHVGDGRGLGMLLSGGRDSRLLAGYVRELGLAPPALTLGRRGDHEVTCARPVARAAGLRHRVDDIAPGGYGAFAERAVNLEHCGHGLSLLHSWGSIDCLRGLAPRALGGYLMDASLGGSLVVAGAPSFERDFARLHAWGLAPAALRGLLRRSLFGDAVDETIEALRAAWALRSQDRAWHLFTDNRHRFNTGGPIWRHAFGSWPVLPLLDRQLAAVAFSLPSATVAGRRAEDEILRRRFPDLARLPVDRNGPDLAPLLPTRAWRIRLRWRRRLARRGVERRRFFRVMDFDGPGWREVRVRAEPERARRADWFVPEALEALLPRAEATVGSAELSATAGMRALLLLLLWGRDRS